MEEYVNRQPQVRVVDNQQEKVTSTEVTGTEADALLRKYYADLQKQNPDMDLSDVFKDAKADVDGDDGFRGFEGIETPKKKPFDPRTDKDRNGEYTDTTYGEEDGFGIEISVKSDMPLPKR